MLADYRAEHRALLSVAWTEFTESCREARDLPVIGSIDAADVEIRISDASNRVLVECQDLTVN